MGFKIKSINYLGYDITKQDNRFLANNKQHTLTSDTIEGIVKLIDEKEKAK